MSLYSPPPPPQPFSAVKPTLLVCWWLTAFSALIILLRVGGRFVRAERLLAGDRLAALALAPLLLRMACVHVILLWGTNNAQLAAGGALSPADLRRKSTASGLVLLARVLYAATLWTLKAAVHAFLRRLVDDAAGAAWPPRAARLAPRLIRGALAATFAAAAIADLAECRPFPHYWRVLPDPGGACRQGYAQLLAAAAGSVLTDLLLVAFPAPLVLRAGVRAGRRARLALLFSLGLAPVAVTLYRVPRVVAADGAQQVRSLYASVDIFFATVATNALVLGSLVRDRGVKKRRFRYYGPDGTTGRRSGSGSGSGSGGRSVGSAGTAGEGGRADGALGMSVKRQYWGSDEDLVGDTGFGVSPELREVRNSDPEGPTWSLAPLTETSHEEQKTVYLPDDGGAADETGPDRLITGDGTGGGSHQDTETVRGDVGLLRAPSGGGLLPTRRSSTARAPIKMSFKGTRDRRTNSNTTPDDDDDDDDDDDRDEDGEGGEDDSDLEAAYRSGVDRINRRSFPASSTRQASEPASPASVRPASTRGLRRGSTALLQDMGGLLAGGEGAVSGGAGRRPPSLLPGRTLSRPLSSSLSVSLRSRQQRLMQPKEQRMRDARSSEPQLDQEPERELGFAEYMANMYPPSAGKPELVLEDPGGLLA